MDPPPPPPPPNLAELMQAMVENQRLLTETIRQMANQGGQDIQHGQHLISIAVSRISWTPSPHLSERLKNPFRLRNG